MASDNEASCVSDPNFAVICSFLECFGKQCGIIYPDIARLQTMLEDTHEVSQQLIDLHIKLLRKTRKSVSPEKWERALVKFCHTYSNQDGWELERFGYKKTRITIKLRLLKVLLETQFDLNQRFKNEVNKLAAAELRLEPLGRDKSGQSYWYQLDDDCNIRVYREDLDEETWELVAKDRESVINLISTLSDGQAVVLLTNEEDSNSLENLEKPLMDTGQVMKVSPSDENMEKLKEKNRNVDNDDNDDDDNDDVDDDDDEDDDDDDNDEDDDDNDEDNDDEDDEGDDDNDDGEKNEKIDRTSKKTLSNYEAMKEFLDQNNESQKDVNINNKPRSAPKLEKQKLLRLPISAEPNLSVEKGSRLPSVIKLDTCEAKPLKSIETSVITTQPLKIEKLVDNRANLVSMIQKDSQNDEKLCPLVSYRKLSVKPIDQVAENLVRIQSGQSEKRSTSKLLEKIAENLAKSSSAHKSVIDTNEKKHATPGFHAGSRGIDSLISSEDDNHKPIDFSGLDLSNRKSPKFDSSIKKLKLEMLSPPYNSRASLKKSHTLADSNKQPMSLGEHGQSLSAHQNAGKVLCEEELKLPSNLPLFFNPSQLSSIQMPIDKKNLTAAFGHNDVGPEIKESVMMVQGEGSGSNCNGNNFEFSETIEEPVRFFYGDGTGRECEAGNAGDEPSDDNNESDESQDEECSEVAASISQKKIRGDNFELIKTDFAKNEESICQSKSEESSDLPKGKFKPTLGVQVFSKSPSAVIKRLSRWDVRKTDEKNEAHSSIMSKDEYMVEKTFDNPDHQKKTKCSSHDDDDDGQSDITSQPANETLIGTTKLSNNKQSLGEKGLAKIYCDSFPFDETLIKSKSKLSPNLVDEPSYEPPRFFFGPNCVAYTSLAKKNELKKFEIDSVTQSSQLIKPLLDRSTKTSLHDSETSQNSEKQETHLNKDSSSSSALDQLSITELKSQTQTPECLKLSVLTDKEIGEVTRQDFEESDDAGPKLKNDEINNEIIKTIEPSAPLTASCSITAELVKKSSEKEELRDTEKDERPNSVIIDVKIDLPQSVLRITNEEILESNCTSELKVIKPVIESKKGIEIPLKNEGSVNVDEIHETLSENSKIKIEQTQELTNEKLIVQEETKNNLTLPAVITDSTNISAALDEEVKNQIVHSISPDDLSKNKQVLIDQDLSKSMVIDKNIPHLLRFMNKSTVNLEKTKNAVPLSMSVSPSKSAIFPEEIFASCSANINNQKPTEIIKDFEFSEIYKNQTDNKNEGILGQQSNANLNAIDNEKKDSILSQNSEITLSRPATTEHNCPESLVEKSSNYLNIFGNFEKDKTRNVDNLNDTESNYKFGENVQTVENEPMTSASILEKSPGNVSEPKVMAEYREIKLIEIVKNVQTDTSVMPKNFDIEQQTTQANSDHIEQEALNDIIKTESSSTIGNILADSLMIEKTKNVTYKNTHDMINTERAEVISNNTSKQSKKMRNIVNEENEINEKTNMKQEKLAENINSLRHIKDINNQLINDTEHDRIQQEIIDKSIAADTEMNQKKDNCELNKILKPDEAELTEIQKNVETRPTESLKNIETLIETEAIEIESKPKNNFDCTSLPTVEICVTGPSEITEKFETLPATPLETIKLLENVEAISTQSVVDNFENVSKKIVETIQTQAINKINSEQAEMIEFTDIRSDHESEENIEMTKSEKDDRGNIEESRLFEVSKLKEHDNDDYDNNDDIADAFDEQKDESPFEVADHDIDKIAEILNEENSRDDSIREVDHVKFEKTEPLMSEKSKGTLIRKGQTDANNIIQSSITFPDKNKKLYQKYDKEEEIISDDIMKSCINQESAKHVRDRETNEDSRQIVQASKRSRTGVNAFEMVIPSTDSNQVIKSDHLLVKSETESYLSESEMTNVKGSFQKTESHLNDGISSKIIEIPVIDQTTFNIEQNCKPFNKKHVKEANKRIHTELGVEEFPRLKSKLTNADYIKNQSLAYDVKSCHTKLSDNSEITLEPKIPIETPLKQNETDMKLERFQQVSSMNLEELQGPSDSIVNSPILEKKLVDEDFKISEDLGNKLLFEAPLKDSELYDFKTVSLASEAYTKSINDTQYEGSKLDLTESAVTNKVTRKRRNSNHEANSDDGTPRHDDDEDNSGKRMKLRGKRTPDAILRKSVEKSRIETASSGEEERFDSNVQNETKDDIKTITSLNPKIKRTAKGRKRRGFRLKKQKTDKGSDSASVTGNTSMHISEDVPHDNSGSVLSDKKIRKKRKMVLGLEIGIDIVVPEGQQIDETPVRQSRRIAQQKIKEEADRRRIEEETLDEIKTRSECTEKKKRRKGKLDTDEEDVAVKEIDKESKKEKKTHKKKKKKESRFNEAKPWQSSSGTSSDEDNQNDEEDYEEEIESEGSVLFKSDHEFSPESDLEKDNESEPMRRARTAQKFQDHVEEAVDEYACQKCGKADHPEWILLCDTCDKGWHCSCLRPSLMLIPEGDWFCPPCQHNLLVNKLRESLKIYDQNAKKHENEILRKKRLAFIGISLDNVLSKNEPTRGQQSQTLSEESDNSNVDNDGNISGSIINESDNDSSSSSESGSTTSSSSSAESEPVYQLRERRCASTSYKFNEYDDMINAAIQEEIEAVQGAGNQGRGKDISTIVNAEKDDGKASELEKQDEEDEEDKGSDKEYRVDKVIDDIDDDDDNDDDDYDEDEEEQSRSKTVVKKLISRKKHRKLNSLDISSEDDPESDEDFKGSDSDEEEDYEDQIGSSDDSIAISKRRGKRGDARAVRRSTRAVRKTRYDEDFIDDDSDESEKPKRKSSRSAWNEESDSNESDNSWRSRKKKSKSSSLIKFRPVVKAKFKKNKKRKRIIQYEESDNPSENDNELHQKIKSTETEEKIPLVVNPIEISQGISDEPVTVTGVEIEPIKDEAKVENYPRDIPIIEEVIPFLKLRDSENHELIQLSQESYQTAPLQISKGFSEISPSSQLVQEFMPELEKKQEKQPEFRRKITYGNLSDEKSQESKEPQGRRTRGRKINYQVDAIMSDSEEELKKALRKTESEDEYVIDFGEGLEVQNDLEKDSDSGDIYFPEKGSFDKHKSPKNRKLKKTLGGDKGTESDSGEPKQRRKPGPKPGSKNKPRQLKTSLSLEGSLISDVPESSLTGLSTSELGEFDDEQLEQIMMEDEEYGRRQLELAAIEIAKNKKKEEREAKKLEKARLKALEILASEQQRDLNGPEIIDSEIPKKKKRGRRSKAEILAEQMRQDTTVSMGALQSPTAGVVSSLLAAVPSTKTTEAMPEENVSLSVNPVIRADVSLAMGGGIGQIPSGNIIDRPSEDHIQGSLITRLGEKLFNPDSSPVKPKRRGRGKGKKTLALEAARAAEEQASRVADDSSVRTDRKTELKHDRIPNVLPTPGSSTSGSAPSTPPASSSSSSTSTIMTTPGLSSSHSTNPLSIYPHLPSQQSSVITRMLQSQPVSSKTSPSFTAVAAAMGQKYFGVSTGGSMISGPRLPFDLPSRNRIPSSYSLRQQTPLPPHFSAVRNITPSARMRVPSPSQLSYHPGHHPMDPSPSGGGSISAASRDNSSQLGPVPAMNVSTLTGSPLTKGGPTPPPPPYVRGIPSLSRFTDNPQLVLRHPIPSFTSASSANHAVQQPSPPPNRPGNFSPYHPQPPPNYHYSTYPQPSLTNTDDSASYQSSSYSSEHFTTPPENPSHQTGPPSTIVVPPPPPVAPAVAPSSLVAQTPSSQTHPHSQPQSANACPGAGAPSSGHAPPLGHGPLGHGKQYDEEGSGEFGGLVSYFSSQREDELDS